MEIIIEVPNSVYLIPLSRALSDYIEAREKSHDNEIRGFAYVMRNVLAQVEYVQAELENKAEL